MRYEPYGHPSSFSKTSKDRLRTCHPQLIRLFSEVARRGFDITIVCGHRGEKAQNEAFECGASRAKWGESDHNVSPSLAIDIAPYIPGVGIPWNDDYDLKAWAVLAGAVFAIARELEIEVEWGGYWSFNDEPHWKLIL